MLKVVVIGSGNVAQHLITVLGKSGSINLVQAYARNAAALTHLLPDEKITDNFATLAVADIYIISVTDDAIAEVSSLLPFSDRLVVHTSGSVALQQIDAKNKRGVFYPLQTFSKNKAVDFKQVPLCLESENETDYHTLQTLAQSVSDSVYNINSVQRQSLHVAAVFVSNFTNHMYNIGHDICEENNVPFDILKPLIKETADKVQILSPKQAQTGPAKRNDVTTMEKHLAFLKDEKIKTIYTLLSQSIQNSNE
ncbi:DUF2520 domain-containing protein [Flavobacterium sp. LaA7.5]|nr:DUF2520 domain-containing protein [Flavobacterium salilacus subsp. altitudinum]